MRFESVAAGSPRKAMASSFSVCSWRAKSKPGHAREPDTCRARLRSRSGCGDSDRRPDGRESHLSVLIKVEIWVASGGNAQLGSLATAGAQGVRGNTDVLPHSVLIREPSLVARPKHLFERGAMRCRPTGASVPCSKGAMVSLNRKLCFKIRIAVSFMEKLLESAPPRKPVRIASF